MSISPVPRVSSISPNPYFDPIDYPFFDIEDPLQPLPTSSPIFEPMSLSQPPPISSNPFNFSSLLSALDSTLDPLYHDPEYLDSYILNQHIDKIKTWMRVNCNHTFPKSKHGWLNVLYMHFQKIYIHMDLDKIIQLVRSQQECRSPRINQLVKRIRKLMRRSTFGAITHSRMRHRLLAHCNIHSHATPEQLYERMVQLGIISEKKRKVQFKPIVEEVNDELSDLTHSFKRIRVV